MTSKYAYFVQFWGVKATVNKPNDIVKHTKITKRPLQHFASIAAIASFFPQSDREKLANLSDLIFDKLTNTSSNVKLNMSDGCQIKSRDGENNYFIPFSPFSIQ
jgi:hypothetical protein